MRTPVLALILASSLASAQLPTTPVTFTSRAKTADRLLADLSKVAGVSLKCSEPMNQEVIVVSVKGTPLGELMKRIATVSSGEWQRDGNGFRLTPSASARAREESAALEKRYEALQKDVQKGINPPKEKDGEAANTLAMTMAGPFGGTGSKHAYEILGATDLNLIAALPPGERIVFSTKPNGMQHAFSDDISAATNALITEHNDQLKKNPPNEQGDAITAQFGDQTPAFLKGMLDRQTKAIGAVAKVNLAISRLELGGFGMMQANIHLYDPMGKLAFDESMSLDMPGSGLADLQEQAKSVVPGAAKTPALATKKTPIEISDDSKEFAKIFSGGMMGAAKPFALSAAVKPKVYQPDKFDPLSFIATDEVFSLAKKLGKPLVADLSDDLFSIAPEILNAGTATVEDYEARLAKGHVDRIVPDPAWLLVAPASPSESRDIRLDRDALATLLQAALTKGIVSLDDVAAYSLHAPSPMNGGVGMLYLSMFVPGSYSQSMKGITSWEMLRIYASLDPVRKEALMTGGRIPMTSLTPYQVEQARKMAYSAMNLLEYVDSGSKPEESTPIWLKVFTGGSMNDYRDEPTEVLPNGLPSDGYLTVKTSAEPFAVSVTSEGALTGGTTELLDAETLATYRMLKENQMFAAASGMLPNPSHGKIGQRTIYAFTFQLTEHSVMHADLNDNKFDAGSAIVSMTSLPSDFEKAIDAHYADLKRSPLGMMGALSAMGGNPVIHP